MDEPEEERKTLEQAKQDGDHAILYADYGGQVLMTIPAQKVLCSEAILDQLCADLSKKMWEDEEGWFVIFKKPEDQEGIWGGMGGGDTTNDLWVHEEFDHMKREIAAVVNGEKENLDESLKQRRRGWDNIPS